MTCEDLLAVLDDVAEDRLAPGLRPSVEAHLTECRRCRVLAADLRRIRETAAALERHRPPDGVWARLATRLEQETRGAATPERTRLPGSAWLAMAATLLLSVAGAVWFLQGWTRGPEPAGNAAAANLVESVEAELREAEAHYAKAIDGLEQIAQAQQDVLDPDTAETLRRNLALIDQAVADSRAALRVQPDSRLARASLFEALRRKVSLLQDTVALMNEMRKGNETGAARLAEGLSKS